MHPRGGFTLEETVRIIRQIEGKLGPHYQNLRLKPKEPLPYNLHDNLLVAPNNGEKCYIEFSYQPGLIIVEPALRKDKTTQRTSDITQLLNYRPNLVDEALKCKTKLLSGFE